MKREIIILSLILISQTVMGQITVEKVLLNEPVVAGGTASLALNLTNPFPSPLTLTIKDKNVLGGNGIDVQCLEISARKGSSLIRYQDITPFAAGDFTLERAGVTYINPESGQEETVKSNKLTVHVEESKDNTGGQQTGITSIYRCGNVNMQSTSYSSTGGSSNIQVNIGGSLSQQMDEMMNHMQPQSMQQRLNQMQQGMAQDTQALKNQMQQQMAAEKQTEQDFQKSVENNPEFQNMQKQLAEQGYQATGNKLEAQTNQTGQFEYSYQKGNQTASIKGSMQEGQMTELSSWSDEQQKKLEESLVANPQFKQMDKQLRNEGYQLQMGDINIPANNKSQFNIQYQKEQRQANITGIIDVNGTVEEIEIEKENEKIKRNWMITPILVVLLLLSLYMWRKRRRKKKIVEPERIVCEHVDCRARAQQMIDDAVLLFREGKEESAYVKVSEAVRYYFKHELNHPQDFTDYQLVAYLKQKKHTQVHLTQQCLNLCGLVKFAKYKTNKKDFQKIIDNAQEIIT